MTDCACITVMLGTASLRLYFPDMESATAAADAVAHSVSVDAVLIHDSAGNFAGQVKGK